MEIIGYFSAVLMGLTLGIIGGGGSILTVPILVYFFRQDALIATTGSLFVVGTTALLGAIMNARRGQINIKTGFIFALPSFAGVILVRKIILPWIPDLIYLFHGLFVTKSLIILISFAILMIFASRAMIMSGKKHQPSLENKIKHSIHSITLKGFFVGCTTGFVGAGGGFLIIPALVLILHMPMRMAVGTSLAIIAANSLLGFTVGLDPQIIDWRLLLSITFLGLMGLTLGHHFSSRFPEKKLKQGFGYFVLVIGSFILIDQIFKSL